ncbi:MAG: 8-amino-7-oxononanoate synthase [Microthrixaceae bacterium]
MTQAPSWEEWVAERNAAIAAASRWRTTRAFDALGPAGTLAGINGGAPADVVSFAANDYLGLSTHPAVTEAAAGALERWGAGAAASRLITGTRPVHVTLETALADWKGAEAALAFSSGFAANLGVLATLGGPGVRIVSDEYNHASIIDGARMARAEVAVYPHLDVAAAAELVAEWPGRSLVVSDAVFSMDGDQADIGALMDVCASTGAALVLDEAHSVWGPEVPAVPSPAEGTGRHPSTGPMLVRVGTLSKTLGAQGGFVAADSAVVALLVNAARPFIFSTGLSPADAAAAGAALGVVTSEEGAALIGRVRALTDRLAPQHPSPIVPIVLGDEARALDASAALARVGYWVPAIRPPTVAPGTSRLRVTFSAAHSDAQVEGLLSALDSLGLR